MASSSVPSGNKGRTKSEQRPLRSEARPSGSGGEFDITPFLVSSSKPDSSIPRTQSDSIIMKNSCKEPLRPGEGAALKYAIAKATAAHLTNKCTETHSSEETSLDHDIAQASGADFGPSTNHPFTQNYDVNIPAKRNRPREDSQISPTDLSESSHQSSSRASSGTHTPSLPTLTPPLTPLQHCVKFLASALSFVDFVCTPRAIRAPEWCDFESTPNRIRSICQDILTKQWTRRLPFIQFASPAEVACGQLASVIEEMGRRDNRKLEVFEFCAGSGGPTPVFEKLINQHRAGLNRAPLQFSISDKYPNLEAWNRHTEKSDNLRVIEESVDAAAPPSVALSRNSYKDRTGAPKVTSNSRILRLFNLSFHHFDDQIAEEILRSTMATADGIVIIELQDRRWGCLAMMAMNWLFIAKASAISVFGNSPPAHRRMQRFGNFFRNMGTWLRVVFTLWWDGLASCMRTREFGEFLKLAEDAAMQRRDHDRHYFTSKYMRVCGIGNWRWREHRMKLHTFPYGYVKIFSGIRDFE
ncbi:hypothetical protein DM02DRAFT_409437 [Periconia macrospinosa]|uniref:S-adenosyl-L-methionine-dependent methyltransferase n=1 Tax=Periconia macrospinosa TaxID=97972 RepID=A0A2V1E8D4_9PLEO|nr:hypothetical protein DM02DRAFT_409437 [Periconia macrospinosa]